MLRTTESVQQEQFSADPVNSPPLGIWVTQRIARIWGNITELAFSHELAAGEKPPLYVVDV